MMRRRNISKKRERDKLAAVLLLGSHEPQNDIQWRLKYSIIFVKISNLHIAKEKKIIFTHVLSLFSDPRNSWKNILEYWLNKL